MPSPLPEQLLHQLVVGDGAAIAAIVAASRTSDDPAILVAAALFAILIFYSAGHLCGIMLARLASTATVVGQQGLVSVVSALVGCLFMPFVTALGQTHHAALEQSLALSRLPPGALPGAPGAAAR